MHETSGTERSLMDWFRRQGKMYMHIHVLSSADTSRWSPDLSRPPAVPSSPRSPLVARAGRSPRGGAGRLGAPSARIGTGCILQEPVAPRSCAPAHPRPLDNAELAHYLLAPPRYRIRIRQFKPYVQPASTVRLWVSAGDDRTRHLGAMRDLTGRGLPARQVIDKIDDNRPKPRGAGRCELPMPPRGSYTKFVTCPLASF